MARMSHVALNRPGAAAALSLSALFMSSMPVVGGDLIAFEDVTELVPYDVHSRLFGGNGFVGVAWFDYDRDDWLDLYVVNGCNHSNALFRNNADGTFTNVASEAGVKNGFGNNGVIAADLDNDGFQEIFLTGEGGFRGTCVRDVLLYYNNGDGTFTDMTAESGLVGPADALSAAFGDINNDGLLDVFITAAGNELGDFEPPNKLFLNNGDLTFTDISEASGVNTIDGACVATFSDYDDDGLMDLIVGNCVRFLSGPIEVFHNNGDLTFTDVAFEAGATFPGYWMGIAPGDFDNDDDIDYFFTNLGDSFPPFFHRLNRNNGDGTFESVGAVAGVEPFEFGWGATMQDFDNDGYLDIFMAGSHPPTLIGPGLGNPGVMLINDHDGTFTNITATMPVNLSSLATSGLAAADYDNDGYVDIAIAGDQDVNQTSGPYLWRNLANLKNNWLTLRLEGTKSNRDAIGARVRVVAGDSTMTREIYAGSSFLSMDSQWPTFGLGENAATDLIEVRWPSGLVEQLPNAQANQIVDLIEGDAGGCPADFDGDGFVGGADLIELLGSWGRCDACNQDLDGDGLVAGADLIILLGAWGPCQ